MIILTCSRGIISRAKTEYLMYLYNSESDEFLKLGEALNVYATKLYPTYAALPFVKSLKGDLITIYHKYMKTLR